MKRAILLGVLCLLSLVLLSRPVAGQDKKIVGHEVVLLDEAGNEIPEGDYGQWFADEFGVSADLPQGGKFMYYRFTKSGRKVVIDDKPQLLDRMIKFKIENRTLDIKPDPTKSIPVKPVLPVRALVTLYDSPLYTTEIGRLVVNLKPTLKDGDTKVLYSKTYENELSWATETDIFVKVVITLRRRKGPLAIGVNGFPERSNGADRATVFEPYNVRSPKPEVHDGQAYTWEYSLFQYNTLRVKDRKAVVPSRESQGKLVKTEGNKRIFLIFDNITSWGETPIPPPEYRVSYEQQPGGILSVKDAMDNDVASGTSVKEGTQLTLSATSNDACKKVSGFTVTFKGESAKPVSGNTVEVTNEIVAIGVVYEPLQYAVSWGASPKVESVTVEGSPVTSGSTVACGSTAVVTFAESVGPIESAYVLTPSSSPNEIKMNAVPGQPWQYSNMVYNAVAGFRVVKAVVYTVQYDPTLGGAGTLEVTRDGGIKVNSGDNVVKDTKLTLRATLHDGCSTVDGFIVQGIGKKQAHAEGDAFIGEVVLTAAIPAIEASSVVKKYGVKSSGIGVKRVERSDGSGGWAPVADNAEIDCGTEIRVTFEESRQKIKDAYYTDAAGRHAMAKTSDWVYSFSLSSKVEGYEVELLPLPEYEVRYEQPADGSLIVTRDGGMAVSSGDKVVDGTRLTLSATSSDACQEVAGYTVTLEGESEKPVTGNTVEVTKAIVAIGVVYRPLQYAVSWGVSPQVESVTAGGSALANGATAVCGSACNVTFAEAVGEIKSAYVLTASSPTDGVKMDAVSGQPRQYGFTVQEAVTGFRVELVPVIPKYVIRYETETASYTMRVEREGGGVVASGDAADANSKLYVVVAPKEAGAVLDRLEVDGVDIRGHEEPGKGYYFIVKSNVSKIEAAYRQPGARYRLSYGAPSGEYSLEVFVGSASGTSVEPGAIVQVDAGMKVYVRVTVNATDKVTQSVVVNGGKVRVLRDQSLFYFEMDQDVTAIEAQLRDVNQVMPGRTLVTYSIEHAKLRVTYGNGPDEGKEIASGDYVNHGTIVKLEVYDIEDGYRFSIVEANGRVDAITLDAGGVHLKQLDNEDRMHFVVWIVKEIELPPGEVIQYLAVREPEHGILDVVRQADGAHLQGGKHYRVRKGEKFDVRMEASAGYELQSSTFDKYPLEDGVFTMPDLSSMKKPRLTLQAIFTRLPEYCTVSWTVGTGGRIAVKDAYGKELENGARVLKGFQIQIAASVDSGYVLQGFSVDRMENLLAAEREQGSLVRNRRVESNMQIEVRTAPIRPPREEGGDPNVPTPVDAVELLSVEVYPNPMGSWLSVRHAAEVERYSLLDVLGRPVVGGVHDGTPEFGVPVGDLPAGVYVLRLESREGGVRAIRLVK